MYESCLLSNEKQTFIFTLIYPLLGIRDENQMFPSEVDTQKNS